MAGTGSGFTNVTGFDRVDAKNQDNKMVLLYFHYFASYIETAFLNQ